MTVFSRQVSAVTRKQFTPAMHQALLMPPFMLEGAVWGAVKEYRATPRRRWRRRRELEDDIVRLAVVEMEIKEWNENHKGLFYKK